MGLAGAVPAGRLLYQCYTTPFASAAHACPTAYRGPEWSQEVLAIGTPAIWWASIPALVFCLVWWLLHRDWRAGATVLAVAAGWLTWFPFVSRTKFYYYATEFEPFLILAIVLCLGLIIGSARASVRAPVDRRGGERGLPARGAAELLLPVPDPGREGHPVHRLAIPHVVPRLDLRVPFSLLTGIAM